MQSRCEFPNCFFVIIIILIIILILNVVVSERHVLPTGIVGD